MTAKMGVKAADEADLPDTDMEPSTTERAARLREAVDAAGGIAAVSRKIGMPINTLGRYVRGRDMKASAMVALAEATGVQLDWLATGTGPRLIGASSAAAASVPGKPANRDLFAQVNMDRMADAYEAALQALAARGQSGEARRVMQVTMLLYDELTEAEEGAGTYSQGNPQKAPQKQG